MSTPRLVFAAAMVAAAWTTVITGLLAVGAARAEAAWLKSGPGTGYAAAGKLPATGSPVLDSAKCNNSGPGPTATLHWSYPAAVLSPGFEVLTSLTPGSPATNTNSTTTTNTSITVPLLSTSKTTYVSVRAAAGSWRGPRSPEVAAC
ncbi:hypothetical protein [Amycolatopsis sp. MtRt-6]|uniref:hypothetical protein n=1 Tax=Amycolatopsis sp. MtRt-6 TaxID=2792782 RepID=UPI001A8DD6FD|nr:hypothetical protein [Amycolatopsis sp. MtRt-6]